MALFEIEVHFLRSHFFIFDKSFLRFGAFFKNQDFDDLFFIFFVRNFNINPLTFTKDRSHFYFSPRHPHFVKDQDQAPFSRKNLFKSLGNHSIKHSPNPPTTPNSYFSSITNINKHIYKRLLSNKRVWVILKVRLNV